jgi:hypothetical protein
MLDWHNYGIEAHQKRQGRRFQRTLDTVMIDIEWHAY